jgi:Icc-related predicted phosphoesterase
MKILIFSDLHLEFGAFEPPETEADIVVLAGDTYPGLKGLEWAKQAFSNKTVLYVLGNHEYYGHSVPHLLNKLRKKSFGSNVHILENDKFEIEGFKFLGCTLWTDFKLFGDVYIARQEAQLWMNDYEKIRVSPKFRKLRAVDTQILHSKSIRWLRSELDDNPQKTIVITHHAPSRQSLLQRENSDLDLLNAAYASALDEFILKSEPLLWIHGHIHEPRDYKIGNTRIVSNPRGYAFEESPSFRRELVVDV